MSTTISSITRQGTFEPFGLQVARGQIQGHSVVSVFGYNPDLDTSEESVWPDGGTVPHPTTASVLDIASTSADDDAAGTGARTVFIEGVDGNYNVVSETVTLDGTNAVSTVEEYLYINKFYVLTAGSGGVNVGQITAKLSSTLYDLIEVGFNNRTTGHYCVPAGFTGYMIEGLFSAGQASGSTAVTGFLKQHGIDNILRVGAVTTVNNSASVFMFDPPYVIPEKNCVGASGVGAANNNAVSSYFSIILIKNSGE